MTLEQIKSAVNDGRTVQWASHGYTVRQGGDGRYLICWSFGNQDANYIGLTWADGKTLNGKEADFSIVS